MSIWTHVAGIVRIDHIPIVNILFPEDVKHLFEKDSPVGSEGGLTFQVMKTQVLTRTGGPLVYGWIAFAGDLRDFDLTNLPNIQNWLNKVTERLKQVTAIIRQGIIEADVETGRRIHYLWNPENGVWEVKEYATNTTNK